MDSSYIERRPSKSKSPGLNLPDMLQELDPDTLAMLEENEDGKSDSLLTTLSFDDILSSISINTSSGDEVNQEKQNCGTSSRSFCSSESSPPSLTESSLSSSSCAARTNQQKQQAQQLDQLQDRDISLFSDVELDPDMPSDTDEFWDALVTSESLLAMIV